MGDGRPTPEALRELANNVPAHPPVTSARALDDAADEIERLNLEVQGANAIIAQERGEVMRLRKVNDELAAQLRER